MKNLGGKGGKFDIPSGGVSSSLHHVLEEGRSRSEKRA